MALLKLDRDRDVDRIPLDDDQVICLVERDGKLVARVQDHMPTEQETRQSLDRYQPVDAVLRRTDRGWVLMDYTGHRTLVNGLRVADCKWVHEGDVIQVGHAQAKLIEIDREEVTSSSRLLDTEVVCFFCYQGFRIGDQVAYCARCRTPHHVECWLCTEDESANEVYCASCGAPHRVDELHHPEHEKGGADEADMVECPHCHKRHAIVHQAKPKREEMA